MEERYLKMIPDMNPQGLIYMCNPSQCFMDRVEELSKRIPVVVVNNQNEKLNVDVVDLDNSKLGRLMARHLLELGHRDVGYIAPPLTVRQKQRSKRVEGFLKEFQKAGLNDMIAFGIMDALHDVKYKVPGDMSVMGCDNTLFAKVKEVSLTTIEHFVIYKGMDACDIIIKKMDPRMKKYSEIEPVSIYHVEYEPRIVVRGTTSYPRTERRKKDKINKNQENISNNI